MSGLKLRYSVRTSEVLRGSTSDMTANIFCSFHYVSSRIGSVCLSGSLGFSKRGGGGGMLTPSGILRYDVEKI
jgi:hypothetical protein